MRWLLLGAFILLAFAMRGPQLSESLWVDELHTAWVVADDLPEVAQRAMVGNQSPAYFYLVWVVVEWFGLTEVNVRLPSIVAGVAFVPLVFLVTERWTRSLAAAVLAAILALADRDLVFYATEGRVYALLQFLSVLRLTAFVQRLNNPTMAWRCVYIAVSVGMFHLHYTTALLWAGEFVCASVFAGHLGHARDRRSLWIDAAIGLFLCLPTAPHLAEVFARREQWAMFVPRPTPTRLMTGSFSYRATTLACALAPPCLMILLRSRMRKCDDGRPQLGRLVWLVLIWMATPVLCAWVLSVSDIARLFLYRYLVSAAAVVPLFAGLLCGLGRTKIWRAATALITSAIFLLWVGPPYVTQVRVDGRLLADRNEDWRGAVVYLNGQPDNLPVIVHSGLIEARTYALSSDPLRQAYLLSPVLGIYRIDARRETLISPPSQSVLPTYGETTKRGAYLLLRTPPNRVAAAVERERKWLADRGLSLIVRETRAFGHVTVVQLAPVTP
jgi:hypothetical protein